MGRMKQPKRNWTVICYFLSNETCGSTFKQPKLLELYQADTTWFDSSRQVNIKRPDLNRCIALGQRPHTSRVTCAMGFGTGLFWLVASNIADFPARFPYLLLPYCKSHGLFVKRHKHLPVPLSFSTSKSVYPTRGSISYVPSGSLWVSPHFRHRDDEVILQYICFLKSGHNECFLLAGFQKLLI